MLEARRDPLDGADVGGHVFAAHAVAARRAALQHAVLVGQRDAEAVDLQLGDVVDRPVAEAGGAAQAFVEGAQVVFVVGVVEAEHRREVRDGREGFGGPAGDALRRRVGGDEIGMLRLERLQLVQQAIELGVGDLRAIVDVIEIFVAPDLSAQPGQPVVGRTSGHP